MNNIPDFINHLSPDMVNEFLKHTTKVEYKKDDIVFSENDDGDAIYLIENGAFSITARKNSKIKHLKDLKDGDYFGEMALLNHEKRSATVTASDDSVVFRMFKNDFELLSKDHPELIQEIKAHIIDRQRELFLREELVDSTGLDHESLHIAFGGDASLRETALYRERYDSAADKRIEDLINSTKDVIINRCAHQIMINFNSGEIRTMSIFDPFREKVHVVDKFVESSYINRHFQAIPYDEKAEMVRNIYKFIMNEPAFNKLNDDKKEIITRPLENWKPLSKEKLDNMISKFAYLRNIESLYLRNVKISMIQDAVRMQFNCDGTHFIDSTNYDEFIEENF